MNRLTTKIKGSNNYCEFELKNAKYKDLFELSSNREIENYVNADLTIAIDKLGKLEDIEEEIGIELTVLFSALKKGIYYFAYDDQLIHDYVYLIDNHMDVGAHEKLSFSFKTFLENRTLLFEDYGETWGLTKEELKND